MREREFGPQKLPELADGSIIYDADLKIIGPSPGDIEWANQVHQELVRERRRVRYQRVDSPGNPQEILPWPLVGKLPRPWRDLVIGGTAAVAGLAAAACSGGGPKPKPEQPPETADNVSKVERPIDKPETMDLPLRHVSDFSKGPYYNAGPHRTLVGKEGAPFDGLDFAGDRVIRCPAPPDTEWIVVAPAAGVIKKAGKPGAKDQSMIEIDHENGLKTTLVHVGNIKVQEGTKVVQGQELGNPSCEFPEGGTTSGAHLHTNFKKDNKPIPANGTILGGWTFQAEGGEYQGTAQKGNSRRVANKVHCGPERYLQEPDCNNQRNDLTEVAVLGDRVERPTPTPTATPTATIDTPRPRGVESENFITEEMRAFAQGLIDEINNRRRIGGLPVLSKNSALTLSAEDYVNFLYKNNNLTTTDLNLNGSPETRAQARGYSDSVRASLAGGSLIEPIGSPKNFFYFAWGESEFQFEVLVYPKARDIGAACVWKQGTIINNQGTRLNSYDLNCLVAVGLERRGFSDSYLAAIDWYVRNLGINPLTIDCRTLLKFCFSETTRNANVVVYNGGLVGSGGGYLLFVGQHADGSWEGIYSPSSYHEFFPPLPKTTLLVQGTDSCLNVRSLPRLSSDRLTCLSDGTQVTIDQGPVFADGFIWVHLKSQGWVVVNYLGGCAPKGPLC